MKEYQKFLKGLIIKYRSSFMIKGMNLFNSR